MAHYIFNVGSEIEASADIAIADGMSGLLAPSPLYREDDKGAARDDDDESMKYPRWLRDNLSVYVGDQGGEGGLTQGPVRTCEGPL
jgi:hypothetical protein